MSNNDPIYEGTELKLTLSLEPIGNKHMEEWDFSCIVYCTPSKKIEFLKKDFIRINSDSYMFIVDTAVTGPGEINVKLIMDIPDADLPDLLRHEVRLIETGIPIERLPV